MANLRSAPCSVRSAPLGDADVPSIDGDTFFSAGNPLVQERTSTKRVARTALTQSINHLDRELWRGPSLRTQARSTPCHHSPVLAPVRA